MPNCLLPTSKYHLSQRLAKVLKIVHKALYFLPTSPFPLSSSFLLSYPHLASCAVVLAGPHTDRQPSTSRSLHIWFPQPEIVFSTMAPSPSSPILSCNTFPCLPPHVHCLSILPNLPFKKYFIYLKQPFFKYFFPRFYLFLERQGGREKAGRETSMCGYLSHAP